jgi:hypothetical protein
VKPLHRLANVDVTTVSLVPRGAVRDPSNPTEPQRFLLRKSDGPVVSLKQGDDEMAKTVTQRLAKGEEVGYEEVCTALIDAGSRSDVRKADVEALQVAYLEHVNPRAAEIWKAERAGRPASVPAAGEAATVALRKAAEEIHKAEPGLSDYDARLQALHRDPELGRYRDEAA